MYLHRRTLCNRHCLSPTHIEGTRLEVVPDPVFEELSILGSGCIWEILWGIHMISLLTLAWEEAI